MNLLCLALLCVPVLCSYYNKSSKVTEINSINFAEKVWNNKKTVFVKFYSPGCGHCKNLVGTWNQLADNMSKHVEIAAINCQDSNDLCQRYQIRGVPSLKVFTLSEADDKRVVLDYDGSRELKPLVEFAKRHASSLVYQIKSQTSEKEKKANKRIVSLDEFLSKGKELPKAILFRNEVKSVGLPYKTLANQFYRKVVIGQVHTASNKEAAEKYGIPLNKDVFVVIPPSSTTKSIVHDGDLTFSALAQFLDKYATVKDWDKVEL